MIDIPLKFPKLKKYSEARADQKKNMLDDDSMPNLLQQIYYNSYLWLDYPDEDRENPPPNFDRIAEPI